MRALEFYHAYNDNYAAVPAGQLLFVVVVANTIHQVRLKLFRLFPVITYADTARP